MRRVAIVGAGMTPFAEHFSLGLNDLLPMAFADCARSVDKGLARSDVQAAWFGAIGTTYGFPSGNLAEAIGLADLPVTRVENSCATGNDAVRNALFAIGSGAFDVALVVGADKLRDSNDRDSLWESQARSRDMAWEYPLGLVMPAAYALHVARYLHESPTTREHMAMVAVKNHRHGSNNPKARLQFEITVEQALEAPTVVTPFGLYDCAPQSDGAAALLLVAEDQVDRYTDRPVWIRGVGLGLDSVMHQHKSDLTTFPATVRAAKQAFAMAGLTPSDIDVAEIHDVFTGIELISYEDLGFADRFGAFKLIETEATGVGGTLPVNPSGGLKCKGHPPGATGVAQCVELFEQLRGDAVNQIDHPRIGLAHNIGGPTAVSAVTILEGPGENAW
jgi:acetyl-CoA C-acetyltransferase